MTEQTQKELIAAAKKALSIISIAGGNTDFVFEFRDLIRKAESEDKNGRESNS
jgi:hypothetical protein